MAIAHTDDFPALAGKDRALSITCWNSCGGGGSFQWNPPASRAASSNFGLFNQAVSGKSDFLIESPVQRIKEDDLYKLDQLCMDPDWHLIPVIEGSVTALENKGEGKKQLRLVGLDLLALGNLPTLAQQSFKFSDDDTNWYDWLGSGDEVWVGQKVADALGVNVGDEISFLASGHLAKMKVRMILDDPEGNLPDDLVLADIPTVQNLLSRPGELNRVEVVIDQIDRREDTKYLTEIKNRLLTEIPDHLTLSPTQNRAADRAAMTAAFRLNLTILSLIAILVGAYLILQALDAAVVRRRAEIATLRSLGVDGSVLFFTYLLEAFALGLLGSIAGVGVGQVLAMGAVGMLADTVNALYFATSVEALRLTFADVLVGIVLGLLFSMIAGWLPARDANQTPPAQVLARGDWSPGFAWLRHPKVGVVLILIGGLFLLFPPVVIESGSKIPVGGFIASGCWILGAALLSGHVLVVLAGWARPIAKSPSSKACMQPAAGWIE